MILNISCDIVGLRRLTVATMHYPLSILTHKASEWDFHVKSMLHFARVMICNHLKNTFMRLI